jgi:hypothetical protein
MNVKTLRTVFAILLVLVGLRLVVQSFVQVGV